MGDSGQVIRIIALTNGIGGSEVNHIARCDIVCLPLCGEYTDCKRNHAGKGKHRKRK